MPISEKEHFDALREADQRAVQLLATANAAKFGATMIVASLLISALSVVVAVWAVAYHPKCV